MRLDVRRMVVLGSLAALVLAGAPAAAPPVSAQAGDPIAERQRLMKLHGALWQDIQNKAKAGNIEAIAVSAEALAINARRIPQLFPAGSIGESRAKPEIWDRWAEFEQAAKAMETEAERLRDASGANDAQATLTIVRGFGRAACGACHTPFRAPEQS
jgi:cytochrome c556